MNRILIIDDDIDYCNLLDTLIQKQSQNADRAHTLQKGLFKAQSGQYDIVFLDIYLPDGNGLTILPDIRHTMKQPEVIIITGSGDHDSARIAIESGAWDYLQKGDPLERINLSLLRVIEYRKDKWAENEPAALKRSNIVGESPAIIECLDLVAQAAASDANILITGATGTGKELIARTIHRNSRRSTRPFIVVDCTVLQETLVESILFGHEKGTFTGANQKREGLVRHANGGTLFLDEIGELPPGIQKSFLRVIQERRFRSVGGKHEITSNFRLISATHRDLDRMVQFGSFRDDLLFRIRSMLISIPDLIDRPGDVHRIARHYLNHFLDRTGKSDITIAPAFFDALESYPWPGNVRELSHAMENAVNASFGNTLLPQFLPKEIRINAAQSVISPDQNDKTVSNIMSPFLDFKRYKAMVTRNYLHELKKHANGNIDTACALSNMSRSRLYELLKTHSISLTQ